MQETELEQFLNITTNHVRGILFNYPITVKTVQQYFNEIKEDEQAEANMPEVQGSEPEK